MGESKSLFKQNQYGTHSGTGAIVEVVEVISGTDLVKLRKVGCFDTFDSSMANIDPITDLKSYRVSIMTHNDAFRGRGFMIHGFMLAPKGLTEEDLRPKIYTEYDVMWYSVEC